MLIIVFVASVSFVLVQIAVTSLKSAKLSQICYTVAFTLFVVDAVLLRLKRYIVTEIVEVFFAVIIALILIMVSFQFAKLLSQAAAGKIVGSAIYQLVALQAVNLFVLLTPFAFFIAMLISLGKLAGDSELIAMKSLGYSDSKTYQALLLLALPLAALILMLTLWVLPQVLSLSYQLTQQAQKESEMSVIQPGNFRSIGGNTTIFVANIDDKQFSKFFVRQRTAADESITVAKQGRQFEKNGERYIELFSGSRYRKGEDGTSQLLSFKRLEALLPTIKSTTRKEKLKSIPTAELLDSPDINSQIEIQRRVTPAISIILLALCAPLLVQFNPRENRYGKFVTAILIYALYANSQYIFQALVEDQKLPIMPGVYTAHLVFLAVLLIWQGWRRQQRRIRRVRIKRQQGQPRQFIASTGGEQ